MTNLSGWSSGKTYKSAEGTTTYRRPKDQSLWSRVCKHIYERGKAGITGGYARDGRPRTTGGAGAVRASSGTTVAPGVRAASSPK